MKTFIALILAASMLFFSGCVALTKRATKDVQAMQDLAIELELEEGDFAINGRFITSTAKIKGSFNEDDQYEVDSYSANINSTTTGRSLTVVGKKAKKNTEKENKEEE